MNIAHETKEGEQKEAPTSEQELASLSLATLPALRSSSGLIQVPQYDRSKLSPGILHINPGHFHRAHQAVFLDNLFQQGLDLDWAIIGASVSSRSMRRVWPLLESQDWLSTIVERDQFTLTPRVIGSMIDFVPHEDDYGPVKKALLDPRIRIVSMTITEGGYFLDASGKFDQNDPQIMQDAKDPENPKTVMGLLVQALKKRREAGHNPFAIMSCDNIPHNGNVTKGVVVGLARMSDPDLADWIQSTVGFPNSMVDRITPKTVEGGRKFVNENFHYDDAWPVFCEPFNQWIVEDDFPHGRPALEKAGVQFVEDVGPYERMKIRILNGGHASLCYPAALLELNYVDEAMRHPVIGPFLDALEHSEIIPCVPPVPDTDLFEYWELIKKRFLNPTIMDQIDRNCKDGSNRQPKFIIPPATDNVNTGRSIAGLALVSALWCRYCQGKTESGKVIAANDVVWDRLHETALKAVKAPTVWVNMRGIYGDLGANPIFLDAFSTALKQIMEVGVEKAMQDYTERVSRK